MQTEDIGEWVRQKCIDLSMTTHTPIFFYLSCTLEELALWTKSTENVIEKSKNGGEGE